MNNQGILNGPLIFTPTPVCTVDAVGSYQLTKVQLISKANCQAKDSSKKRANESVFTRGLVLYEQPFKSGCLDF